MRAVIIAIYSAIAFSFMAGQPSPVTDAPVMIAIPNSDLSDLLKFYAQLTKRKVWVELGLTAKISVDSHGPVSHAQAVSLLRDTVHAAGIEIREVGDSEAYVSRVAR